MEITDIGDLEHLMAGGFIDEEEYDALAKEHGIDTDVDAGNDFSMDLDMVDSDDFEIPY